MQIYEKTAKATKDQTKKASETQTLIEKTQRAQDTAKKDI
jgi:hypothetical protein